MINEVFIDSLTDEELLSILDDPASFDVLLAPMKRSRQNPTYRKFDKYLGKKDKKSILVKKYLPKIALELYKGGDGNYVSIVKSLADNRAEMLVQIYEGLYDKPFSSEEVQTFSGKQLIDFINRHVDEDDSDALKLDLFWTQLKLNGVIFDEEIKKEVNSYFGVIEENNNIEESKDSESEEETTDSEQKEKVKINVKKKTTALEKEAKRKADEAKRKKAEKEKKQEKAASEQLEEKIQNDDIEEVTEKITNTSEEKVDETIGVDKMIGQIDDYMHAYVGTVDIVTGSNRLDFYNFNPIGELRGKEFTAFQEYELSMRFPDSVFRNILLFYTSDQAKIVEPLIQDGMLLVLEYEVDEFEDNLSTSTGERNNTGYKVRLLDGFRSGKIRYLWQDGFYRICKADSLLDDICTAKRPRIEKEGLIDGEKLFVELKNGVVAGPFAVSYKPTLESFTIETDASSKKYLFDGYKKNNLNETIFERTFSKGPLEYYRGEYYSVPSELGTEIVDVISDKLLLETFSSSIKEQGQDSIKLSEIPEVISNINNNIFAGETIPEDIVESRYLKLEKLLSGAVDDQESQDKILDVISDVLINAKDNEKLNDLIKKLFEKENFAENIQSVKYLREQIETLKDERDNLEAENKQVQFEKDLDEARQKEEYRLSEEFARKSEELEKIKKQISDYKDLDLKNKTYKQLDEDVKFLQKHKEILSKDVDDLELSFKKMIKDSSIKMAEITFDGFVSSKMIEAASKWNESEKAKSHETFVEKMNKVKQSELSDYELIDYLVDTIQIARPHFDRNMIINLMICSMQGMLTVFAGAPGCGKTSICNIISRVLGTRSLPNIETDETTIHPNRYVQVSVERGWTSKRDFIGYFNPLTKTFEENNHEVFDGLKVLNTEARSNICELPFIMLLDEANLSPMEYYWADFMNVCDDLENNHTINLGNENVFEIPETLHFLATINNDHTTETLSPRLIDRAWVVTLPQEKKFVAGKDIPEDIIQIIGWESLKSIFVDCDESDLDFSSDTQAIYEEIKKMLSEIGSNISVRTDKAIRKYYAVASKLMDDNTDVGYKSDIIALDYAISQKILPRLSGNGDTFEQWLVEFRDFSKKKYLNNTASIITRMLDIGNRQMKFYQFFN